MNEKPLQLALREMREHLGDPRVLGGIGIVGILLGIAGPFGTTEVLATLPRLAYWLAIAAATYGVGFAVSRVALHALGLRIAAPWLRVMVFGVIAGAPVTLVVLGINLIAFGAQWQDAIEPLTLWFDATVASIGVVTVAELIATSTRPAAPPSEPMPEAQRSPAILRRLPLPQRGRLWALVVADHYVEVLTERGKGLLLLRLSDAIGEAEGEPGVQIHRSHWVALAAVSKVVRTDGKLLVELPDGRRLPVSRGYLAAAKAAGIG